MSFKKLIIKLAVAAVLLIGAFAANSYYSQYEYGDQYIVDQEGNKVIDRGFKEVYYAWDCPDNVAQYKVSNKWPEWTPLYEEKWGLVNLDTGEVSEPKYVDKLQYRGDGLAWDYEGHLIDRDGNIVVDCKWYWDAPVIQDNPRKFAFYALGEKVGSTNLLDKNYKYYGVFNPDNLLQSYDTLSNLFSSTPYIGIYHENGLTRFLSISNKRFGFMDKDGNVVIPARYLGAEDFDENGLAKVYREYSDGSGYGLINENGEIVLNTEYSKIWNHYLEKDHGYILCKGEIYHWDLGYADKEGNVLLECEYCDIVQLRDKYVAARKEKDSPYIYMDADCKPLFESGYTPYDFDSEENALIVKDENGIFRYMDFEGNILDVEYSED